MTDLVFDCIDARPTATPPSPTLQLSCGSRRPPGPRSTRSPCAARSASSPSAAATRPRRPTGCCELFGEPPRWGDTLKPMQFATVVADGARLHRQPRDRPAGPAAPTTSRWPPPSTSTLSTTARSRCCCCSAGRCSPRGSAASRSSRCPGTRRRATGCRWRCGARSMDRFFPAAAGSGCAATRSTRCTASRPSGPCRPGTTPSRRCSSEAGEDQAVSAPDARPSSCARKVADAVLYEGYLLYPYRASAAKNQARWQFGVAGAPAWRESGPDEPAVDPDRVPASSRDGRQPTSGSPRPLPAPAVARRRGGRREAGTFTRWPACRSTARAGHLGRGHRAGGRRRGPAGPAAGRRAGHAVRAPGGRRVEPSTPWPARLVGRSVRRRWPLSGRSRAVGRAPARSLRPGPAARPARERHRLERPGRRAGASPCGTRWSRRHSLLGDRPAARSVSLLDPPEWAKPAAEACAQPPHLAGADRRRAAGATLMLSSPIILTTTRDRPREPGRPLRRHRDRRDPDPADHDPHRRREARGQGDRPAGGGDHRPGRQHAPRAARAPPRRRPLPEVGAEGSGAGDARPTRRPRAWCRRSGRRRGCPDESVRPGFDPDGVSVVSPETDGVVVAGITWPKGSRAACARPAPGRRPGHVPGRPEPPSRRCSSTSTATATWPSPSTRTRRPTSSAGTAATCTSRPTRSSRR